MPHQAVVIDNGTGYTKMGYAGNPEPQFVIPTVLATRSKPTSRPTPSEEFDFYIGNEAQGVSKQQYSLLSPIRHGQIENWDLMESFWQHCFFKYLRCDPEEHAVLLTEPPLNAPENREYTAEIMFESFNVPHLYIGVQAVLALAASWMDAKSTNNSSNLLTGTVVDSGDGVTHIIPVVDGYAIGSAIKHIPLAGRELTLFLQQLLRDRPDINLPPEDTMEAARHIKENFCYVCPDLAKEFLKFDADSTIRREFSWTDPKSGKSIKFDIGHERFLVPEVFFSPEMSVNSNFTIPLPNLIDDVIQACPIDCRRGLYNNIVLSGGSTMFKDFPKRLQRDLKTIVDTRLSYALNLDAINKSQSPQVNVVAHRNQRYAVYSGGSLLASMEQFPMYCHSKAEYDEFGPGICRQSRVFGALFS